MKYIQRQLETVDAYQFQGGEKDGMALAQMIDQNTYGATNSRWRDGTIIKDHVCVVGDDGSTYIRKGDWVVFHEDRPFEHFRHEDFVAKYKQVREPVTIIWKDIPGHLDWQIGSNGRVRNTKYPGTKRRTKDGDFILYGVGGTRHWSEKELGSEEEVRKFFAE